MKKTFFLLLTLAIPVSIFLFLKFFGTNSFDVPVLFENGIPGCENSGSPHRVSGAYFSDDGARDTKDYKNSFKIVGVLDQAQLANQDELLVQLVRIQDAFYEVGSPHFLLYVQNENLEENQFEDLLVKAGMKSENLSILSLERERMDQFLRCGIGLEAGETPELDRLVLVDKEGRIRGMYKSTDMEQTDELILELKILKQMD